MKTIKIIELLNKIANGETPPRKIRYLDTIYVYNNIVNDYAHEFSEYDSDYLLESVDVNEKCLNNKIEIIEDEKKIEKLDMSDWNENNGQSFSLLRGDFNKNSNTFANKINEIIDYINDNDNHIPRID